MAAARRGSNLLRGSACRPSACRPWAGLRRRGRRGKLEGRTYQNVQGKVPVRLYRIPGYFRERLCAERLGGDRRYFIIDNNSEGLTRLYYPLREGGTLDFGTKITHPIVRHKTIKASQDRRARSEVPEDRAQGRRVGRLEPKLHQTCSNTHNVLRDWTPDQ